MAELKLNLHDENDKRGVFLDGHKIKARSVKYRASVTETPVAEIELIYLDDLIFDIDKLIIEYKPKTIQEATQIIVNAIKNDFEIRMGFVSSIASAIIENNKSPMPLLQDEYYLATAILKRLVGEE